MRKVDFSQFGSDSSRMFTIMWTAFRGAYPKMAAGYENTKLCNKIGAKLENISFAAPRQGTLPGGVDGDLGARELKDGASLFLDGLEYDKFLAMMKFEEIGWTYEAGRLVEKLIDAVTTAPDVEVEEKK